MAESELIRITFDGALDSTTDPGLLPPNKATALSNFTPDVVKGAFTVAPGRKKNVASNSLATGANTAFLAMQFSTIASLIPVLLAWSPGVLSGANVQSNAPAAWATQSIPAGTLGGNTVSFCQYQGIVFGISNYGNTTRDEGVKNYPNNAFATWTLWQIDPPLNAPTNGGTSGVGLTGTYAWCYTYYNSITGQESSRSPALLNVTLANQGNIINWTASTDTQVTHVNVYRIGGTSQTWTQVAHVAIGTTTYTDNTADTALTGASLVPHRDPPASFVKICVHKDRIWGFGQVDLYPYTFGPNNAYVNTPQQLADLWFTRYGEPWSFDCVNNVMPLGRDVSADYAVDLLSTGSVLLALKAKTAWVVVGDSELDFRGIKLGDVGCIPGTAAAGYGMGFWVSNSGGVWASDGQSLQMISDEDSSIKKELDAILLAFNTQTSAGEVPGGSSYWAYPYLPNLTIFSAVVTRRTYMLSTFYNGAWVTYCYSIFLKKWWKLPYGAPSLVALSENRLLIGLNTVDQKNADWWLFQTNDDYLTPNYAGTWQTGNLDGGAFQIRKSFSKAVIKIPPSDPTNQIKISFYVDGVLIVSPTFTPRAVGAIPGTGYNYFRVSFPATAAGHEMTIVIQATVGAAAVAPPVVSEIRVYGGEKQELPPPQPLNGST